MARPFPQTIAEVQGLFLNGLSPVDIVQACLDRVEKDNDKLGAMIFISRSKALDEAREAERAIRAGERVGPLHGIPLVVKDMIDVRGWKTTGGSRVLDENDALSDARCVTNLRSAGAIIIGKSNLHELTAGNHDNPWYGKVINPLDADRGTGGTSSGSAAAVAAGFCFAAIGTDTGGSNRSTAAATGLVGFKPTNGVIDATGTMPTAPTFDTIGPIARTVADAGLLHYAMAGIDPPLEKSVSIVGMRIGLCPDLYEAAVDPAVAAAHQTFLTCAQRAGAQIDVLPFRFAREVREAGLTILVYEFTAHYGQLVEAHPERVGTAVRDFLSNGALISAAAYQSALASREQLQSEFERLSFEIDVLATPVVPGLAPRLSDELTAVGENFVPYGLAGGHFRRWANFFGVPALAMPVRIPGALPASIQITTPRNTEDYLFTACEALSRLETGSVN